MKILVSLETTGAFLGISLYSTETRSKIGTHYSEARNRSSDLLVPTLEKLLRKNRLKKKDIRAVAVDVGPGSFTGVRVGVSSARALGQALNVSVLGVSSLAAMAHEKFKTLRNQDACVVSLIKALEGEIYAAAYVQGKTGRLSPLLSPGWMTDKEWEVALGKISKRAGKGITVQTVKPPHPESVAELALQKLTGKENPAQFDYNEVEPLYLQPSWAERKKPS